jgi:hypothetical protein
VGNATALRFLGSFRLSLCGRRHEDDESVADTGLLGAIRSRVNLRSQGALFGSKSNNARGALPEF